MNARRWMVIAVGLMLHLPAQGDEVEKLVSALGGADAVAEQVARERLVALGAVEDLARMARDGRSLPGRLVAVELLGRIGTPAADALIGQLRMEKDLSIRNQICIQLGQLRDPRAVPVLIEWLKTIRPGAIDDVPGPKEAQPSTCYLRHVEALAQIGDAAAIPALEEFARKIPKGVGYGGFLSNFLAGATQEAVLELRERAGFDVAARAAGIADVVPLVLAAIRRDPVARFRMHDDELVRRTEVGRAAVERLTRDEDAAVAAAAKAVLGKWDELKKEGAGQ